MFLQICNDDAIVCNTGQTRLLEASSMVAGGRNMMTLLIVLLVVFLLGGGGWGYSRYRRN
jgi:hypothetical protein